MLAVSGVATCYHQAFPISSFCFLVSNFLFSPAFWMNLQTRYDLEVAEDEIAAKVPRDVQPLEAVTAPDA